MDFNLLSDVKILCLWTPQLITNFALWKQKKEEEEKPWMNISLLCKKYCSLRCQFCFRWFECQMTFDMHSHMCEYIFGPWVWGLELSFGNSHTYYSQIDTCFVKYLFTDLFISKKKRFNNFKLNFLEFQ